MSRPPLPADRRAAIVCLLRDYADLLTPEERQALFAMHGHPALTTLDRLQLSVIASIVRGRAIAEVRHAA